MRLACLRKTIHFEGLQLHKSSNSSPSFDAMYLVSYLDTKLVLLMPCKWRTEDLLFVNKLKPINQRNIVELFKHISNTITFLLSPMHMGSTWTDPECTFYTC